MISQPFLGLFMLLQIIGSMLLFGMLLLFMFFCPGVQATQGAFPNITFEVFSAFITDTFGPKISLSTVLMLLFTLNKNTDLLNMHSCSRNKQFDYEQIRSSSTWMNILSHSIQKNTTKKKMKSLFKINEIPDDVLEKLYPISNESIEPILILCPISYQCMDGACEPCSLLMLNRTNQVPEVILIKGTKIYKNVSVLSAYCLKCKTSYFVDHETHGPPNDRLKTYLNDAVYLKVGQSTYIDHVFSNAVVNGIFSFHASTAAYAEFWTNSYGKAYSIKVPRCQMWQTFTQESIRVVFQELEIIFEAPNNTSISELTYRAYDSLGEKGEIRLSDRHTCSECTQDYKAIADWVPQNNDPAALLGVDDNGPVLALAHENLDVPNIPIQAPNASPNATQSPVKMVVMDGIIMGPVHCAAINCTADVINARGEAFCATHVTLYANKCCIVGCGNIKVEDTQACYLH